jgi:predicted metalloprotease with PDZ domain
MPKTSKSQAAVHYRVEVANAHAHLFRVTLTVAKPKARQQLSLPVWIAGSYMVREFSKHLQNLSAAQGDPVKVTQLDKCTWQLGNKAAAPLQVIYEVYAFDTSVRTAFLDADRAFFNPTSLCLQVVGQEQAPHSIELVATKNIADYAVFTPAKPLKVLKNGWGSYQAANYEELADCPFEITSGWHASFTERGVPHRLVVSGAAQSLDSARLLADTQKIVAAEMQFWHGAKPTAQNRPPFDDYTFLLNAVDDGYGGLEHRNSTVLIAARKDLPRKSSRLGNWKPGEGYITLLGLISHEYFHTWNVKRLRPAEFKTYDFSRENYTELLWFFEGFTSYYDDLLLRRAGLIDDAQYLKLVAKTINQVQQTPGRKVQSAAQASFDAWVKYYRQDENTANATVSYYTKGALIAMCFDLSLRAEGKTNLDEVMRGLWSHCKAGPMTEQDFAAVLRELSGRSWAKEIKAWVHGTEDLPLKALLQQQGLKVTEDDAPLAQRLGLRVTTNQGSVQVKTVLRGGAAERAGLCAGDEWLGVEVSGQGWRITQLEELLPYLGDQTHLKALVSRDKRLHTLPLEIPRADTVWRLSAEDAAKVSAWLQG